MSQCIALQVGFTYCCTLDWLCQGQRIHLTSVIFLGHFMDVQGVFGMLGMSPIFLVTRRATSAAVGGDVKSTLSVYEQE